LTKSKERVEILRIHKGAKDTTFDEVIVEGSVRLEVDGRPYKTLICTPLEMEELVVGFLFADGVIDSIDDIDTIETFPGNQISILLTKKETANRAISVAKAPVKIESDVTFSAQEVFDRMKEFTGRSKLFLETGGVHSAAICDHRELQFFAEDISRHNAMDKVIGKALLARIDLSQTMVMTSGRIARDLALKAVKAMVPIVVSRSAPTDLAIQLAKASKLTLIGFVREDRMNLYCGEKRIEI
jgi:FdhD protein